MKRNIEATDDTDGGITVTLTGRAAKRFQAMAERHGMTVEELGDKLVRDAIARGIL